MLPEGAIRFSDGANRLSEAIPASLRVQKRSMIGPNRLPDGTTRLPEGAIRLSDGATSFYEGENMLYEALTGSKRVLSCCLRLYQLL